MITNWGRNLIELVFPNLCLACNAGLTGGERYLCLGCQMKLPETRDHLTIENGVEKSLWGRIPFERAFSFLYFNQHGITQRLLHELKYRGNQDLAYFLGQMYAERIRKTAESHGIDGVVAVPLHPSKFRKRGYNQSEVFARGIAETLGLENLSEVVIRQKATDTQTRKSREERWRNVDEIFRVKDAGRLEGRHLLVVDDVITTGATIESCAKALVTSASCRISVASIAFAA